MMVKRIYALLLRLYPPDFYATFAAEMRDVFALALARAGQRGRFAVARLCLRELRDLPAALIREHQRESTVNTFRKQHPRLTTFGSILIFALLFAGIVSQLLWGYVFTPPPVENLTDPITTITGVGGIKVEDDYTVSYSGAVELPPGAKLNHDRVIVEDAVPYLNGIRTIEYSPLDRALLAIADRRPQTDYTPDAALLESLSSELRRQNVELGLDSWSRAGRIIAGEGADGTQLLFINMTSTQISNDTYVYTDLLFEVGADESLTLLDRQGFRYDVAGIEGFYFPVLSLWCGLGLLFLWGFIGLVDGLARMVRRGLATS